MRRQRWKEREEKENPPIFFSITTPNQNGVGLRKVERKLIFITLYLISGVNPLNTKKKKLFDNKVIEPKQSEKSKEEKTKKNNGTKGYYTPIFPTYGILVYKYIPS